VRSARHSSRCSRQTHTVPVGYEIASTRTRDPLQGNPFAHAPTFHWEISGAELLASGTARHELGGTELFLAVERLTDQPSPVDLAGRFEVAPQNAGFGFRPVYVFGRQRDDSKVWSSAQFITFDR
jgi:hypothetical protein